MCVIFKKPRLNPTAVYVCYHLTICIQIGQVAFARVFEQGWDSAHFLNLFSAFRLQMCAPAVYKRLTIMTSGHGSKGERGETQIANSEGRDDVVNYILYMSLAALMDLIRAKYSTFLCFFRYGQLGSVHLRFYYRIYYLWYCRSPDKVTMIDIVWLFCASWCY